jgi:uncharacterized repeat protein (TIGR03847 family)
MDSGPDRLDGDAWRVMVEAIGEPGSRRFRFVALIEQETVVLWMEKQQLQALGIALGQVLERVSEASIAGLHPDAFAEFNLETRRQFRVGRMELGFDEASDRLVMIAHDIDEPGQTRITCRITRQQALEISEDVEVIVNAGRPICPLCLEPMGPGPHVCPGMNGHLPIHNDDTLLEEE